MKKLCKHVEIVIHFVPKKNSSIRTRNFKQFQLFKTYYTRNQTCRILHVLTLFKNQPNTFKQLDTQFHIGIIA